MVMLTTVEIILIVLFSIWFALVMFMLVTSILDKNKLGKKLYKHMTPLEVSLYIEFQIIPPRLQHIADEHYANKNKIKRT